MRLVGRQFASVEEVAGTLEIGGVSYVNCDFSRLKLHRINFKGSTFDACKFNESDCRWSIFEGCQFLSCDLTEANFSHCDLRRIVTRNCKAEGLDLFNADVTINCNIFKGLKLTSNRDAYLLFYWVAGLQSEFSKSVDQLIPERIRLFLESRFERDPS